MRNGLPKARHDELRAELVAMEQRLQEICDELLQAAANTNRNSHSIVSCHAAAAAIHQLRSALTIEDYHHEIGEAIRLKLNGKSD